MRLLALVGRTPRPRSSSPRYDRKAGIGTLIATMLPYTTVFLIAWSLLLVAWMALGLPVGPGAGLRYAPAR